MGAQQIDIQQAPQRRKNRPGKARIVIPAGVIAVVVLVICSSGAFSSFQEHRLLAKARRFYEEKNYSSAALFVERVLQFRPKSIEANELMADLADSVGSPHSLYWRRTVAELNPGSLEDHLAWADTALRLDETAMAEQALANVESGERNSGAYFEMEGRVADALNQQDKAEDSFSGALRQEPQNKQYQLDLARLRLRSADANVRDDATKRIEALAIEPELFSAATHALIEAAQARRDAGQALALAKKLQGAPNAPFEDRILYLGLLRDYQQPEFPSYLADLEQQNVGDANRIASLIAWMDAHSLALLAIDWSKRLPTETRTRVPVAVGLAEAYGMAGDWTSLKKLLSGTNWGDLEFMRQAILARIARHDGDESAWQAYWYGAVHSASSRPEALAALARTAVAWGWEDRSEDLLWSVARGSYDQQWALKELYRRFFPMHSTRNLLKVVTRMYELDPSDPWTRNNLAAYELLLQSNVQQAVQLARDLYQGDPHNPDYASTYAFALHLLGRSAEGAQILKSVGQQRLQAPAYAVYYGALLAAGAGSPADASKYLDIAASGDLFPEERALLEEARAQVANRQTRGQDTGATP